MRDLLKEIADETHAAYMFKDIFNAITENIFNIARRGETETIICFRISDTDFDDKTGYDISIKNIQSGELNYPSISVNVSLKKYSHNEIKLMRRYVEKEYSRYNFDIDEDSVGNFRISWFRYYKKIYGEDLSPNDQSDYIKNREKDNSITPTTLINDVVEITSKVINKQLDSFNIEIAVVGHSSIDPHTINRYHRMLMHNLCIDIRNNKLYYQVKDTDEVNTAYDMIKNIFINEGYVVNECSAYRPPFVKTLCVERIVNTDDSNISDMADSSIIDNIIEESISSHDNDNNFDNCYIFIKFCPILSKTKALCNFYDKIKQMYYIYMPDEMFIPIVFHKFMEYYNSKGYDVSEIQDSHPIEAGRKILYIDYSDKAKEHMKDKI